MLIGKTEIRFDVEKYLEEKFDSIRPVGENLMTLCPFHLDSNPSFGVHALDGTYNCFGCGAKGNIQTLVYHLDHFDSVEDAENYLVNLYGVYETDTETIHLDFGDDSKRNDYWIDDSILCNYRFKHSYLNDRGLSNAIQHYFEIGFDVKRKAVTFPYRDHKGRLVTVKFRKVLSKQFWYEPKMPSNIKAQTLYGFYQAKNYKHDLVAITEAEIDCLSVWDVRRCSAFALGGNTLTDLQANLIRNHLSPTKEILIFTDNDEGGRAARNKIVDKLSDRFVLSEVDWTLLGRPVKDANDCTKSEIAMLVDKRKPIGLNIFFS